jgi:hypothetical protein
VRLKATVYPQEGREVRLKATVYPQEGREVRLKATVYPSHVVSQPDCGRSEYMVFALLILSTLPGHTPHPHQAQC